MKRSFKDITKRSFAILLVSLLFAVLPAAVFARPVAPIEYTLGKNGLDHFSLSNDGMLTWTSRSTSYDRVMIKDAAGNLLDYEDLNVILGSQVINTDNIIVWMDSLCLDTGKYIIEEHPWFGGSVGYGIEDYIYYNYTSPYERLEAPVNLRWFGQTAMWDKNPKATSYVLSIYDELGTKVVSEVSTNDTLYVYPKVKDGYWFEVKARSDSTSPIYRDSAYNESPRKKPTQLISANVILSVPVAGMKIEDLTLNTDGGGFTILSSYWKLNDSGSELSTSTEFELGQTYYLYINFTPEDGFYFTDGETTYTVNGQPTEWSGFEAEENRKIGFTIGEASYTISFDPNGGTGEMKDISGLTGPYTLPECGFEAPLNKQFKGWSKTNSGDIVTVVDMTEDIKVYALWEDISASKFTDVDPNEYYAKAVQWAVDNGITAGTSETTFSPNDYCTRGQIVSFLWRSAGKPEPSGTDNPFVDVAPDDYFYKAVLWAVENDITAGTSDTTFSPSAICTRGQTVTFLYRYAGKPEPSSTDNPFTDVSEDQYYYKPVLWAVERKITAGTSETTFSPDAFCTRGQIVTFLYRSYT